MYMDVKHIIIYNNVKKKIYIIKYDKKHTS